MPNTTPTSAGPNLDHLHADTSDTIRAAIAFGAGQAVQYHKPSTGTWVTVARPKFNPSHAYRPAPRAGDAVAADDRP